MIDRDRDFEFDEPVQRRPTDEPGNTFSSMNREDSDNLVDLAKQRGSQASDQAQQAASDVVEQVRQQASSRVSDQKDKAAEMLTTVANAVRQTGTQLRSQDQAGIAEYADRTAQQIERFSGYLNEHGVEDMVYEVEHFARRQPLLFVGGTLLLGFLGARFLKSSAPTSQSGLGYGHQVPRSRVPARPGYPDSPRGTFGTPGPQTPGTYPTRGVPQTPGSTTGTETFSGTGTGTSSDLNTPPAKPEDTDAAA